MAEVTAILTKLMDQGMVGLITPSFNSPVWFLQKSGGFWKVTVNFTN